LKQGASKTGVPPELTLDQTFGGADHEIDENNITYTVSKLSETYHTMMEIKDALMINDEEEQMQFEGRINNNDILNI